MAPGHKSRLDQTNLPPNKQTNEQNSFPYKLFSLLKFHFAEIVVPGMDVLNVEFKRFWKK